MYQDPTQAEILLNDLLNMRHLRSDEFKKQQIQLIITELEKEQISSPTTSVARDEDNNDDNMPSPVPLVEETVLTSVEEEPLPVLAVVEEETASLASLVEKKEEEGKKNHSINFKKIKKPI